jgi:hypothetical protein
MEVARAAHSATSHFVLATARLNFGGRQTVELCLRAGQQRCDSGPEFKRRCGQIDNETPSASTTQYTQRGSGQNSCYYLAPAAGGPIAVADGEDRNDLHALRRRPSPLQRGRSGGQCFASPQRHPDEQVLAA